MSDIADGITINCEQLHDQAAFGAALKALRLRSRFSYKALAAEIGRPATTVHGWFAGRHLPYQRDNDDVERMLKILGIDDPAPWMAALARCREVDRSAEQQNPYRGLEPYTEADADQFYGRTALVEHLVTRLREPSAAIPFIVIGASGSGKTSVIRAGLVPTVRRLDDRQVRVITPGDDPTSTLDNCLGQLQEDAASCSIIVVDQFEELFHHSTSTIDAVVDALEAHAGHPGCDVVIGLRGDFFHRAATHRWLLEGLKNRQEIVTAPPIEVVPEIINGPALSVGLTVEPDLTARLARDFGEIVEGRHSTGALPLLSHVLSQIAETRDSDQLGLAGYEAVGGIKAAVERSAEEGFATLSGPNRSLCARLFKQLVKLGQDTVPTRRTVDLDAFDATQGTAADVHEVLDAFTERRILTTDHDSVRISHEALLTAWSRYEAWIEEERSALESIQHVQAAARIWLASEKDHEALLAGRSLESAQRISSDPNYLVRLDDMTCDFVTASIDAGHRRSQSRRRRSRLLAFLATVATLAAVLTTIFAVRADQASDRATIAQGEALSRQLALQSSILRSSDPTLSRQLAVVAYDTSPTLAARTAVLDASADAPGARYLGDPGPTALGVAADGSRIAYSNSVTGAIAVMSRSNQEFESEFELALPDPEVDVYAIALSPDGRYMVSGGTDLEVSLWDLDGDRAARLLDDSRTQFELPVQSLVFDPTGQFVYGSGTGNGIGVWNIRDDPGHRSSLIPNPGSTMGIDLHADRSIIATGTLDGRVALWNTDSPAEMLWEVESPAGSGVNTVDIAPDGTLLAAGFRDGRYQVWDISRTDGIVEVGPEIEPFGTWVNSVRFSPDGKTLTAGSDGLMRVWRTDTWEEVGSVRAPTVITNIRFVSNDLALMAIADGSVRTVDMTDASVQHLGASIWSTTFSGDGKLLVASARGRTLVWDVQADRLGPPTGELFPPDPGNRFTGTNAIAPNNRWVALGSAGGQVYVFDLHAPDHPPVALSDLNELADALNDTSESAILVEGMAFSFDSSLVAAVGGDGYAQLWTLSIDGKIEPARGFQHEGFARNVAFASDRPLLAVASDTGAVILYDVSDPATPVEVSKLATGDDSAYGIAFHPTADIIATSNFDNSTTLWDITQPSSPTLVARIIGPSSRVYALAFDESGDHLGAAVGDSTAWVWDTSTPNDPSVIDIVNLANSSLYTVAFSPDGDRLVGAGADQRIYVWHLDAEAARDRICRGIGDPITSDEWSNLVPTLPYDPPCD